LPLENLTHSTTPHPLASVYLLPSGACGRATPHHTAPRRTRAVLVHYTLNAKQTVATASPTPPHPPFRLHLHCSSRPGCSGSSTAPQCAHAARFSSYFAARFRALFTPFPHTFFFARHAALILAARWLVPRFLLLPNTLPPPPPHHIRYKREHNAVLHLLPFPHFLCLHFFTQLRTAPRPLPACAHTQLRTAPLPTPPSHTFTAHTHTLHTTHRTLLRFAHTCLGIPYGFIGWTRSARA